MQGSEPIRVIIKEREVEFISDYPDGWKFSAGDPFKFPVLVSNYRCFIKRFEQKSPEDISGWDLLVKMTGKYEKTLSRVYDIKNVQEDDKEIYYVFYEHLDGTSLDKSIKDQAAVNLVHLNNDLFSAMRALQGYGFWFADFTEKNIFCEKGGNFVLVDVDSTQRITDLPHNEMYGSKDYWILVLKFYKEILDKDDLRLSDVNGISLNYLQIPFLVLRLKLLLNGNVKDYNSTEVFNQLPSQLNEMAPELKDIYLEIIKNGKNPLSNEAINKIEDIVESKIIRTGNIPDVVVDTVSLPVIKNFTTSSKEISSGGTFTLGWEVQNTNKLELYKNGARFKTLDAGQKDLVLKEFADGTRQQSSYQLIAYKDLDMAKSDPITITLKETVYKGKARVIWIISALAILAAVSFFLYRYFNNRNTYEVNIAQYVLHQGLDSTITIYGKNLPPPDKIDVLFNETQTGIASASTDSLVVSLPTSTFVDADDAAFVSVNIDGKRYKAGSFIYLPPIVIEQMNLYEDSLLTFNGKGLKSNVVKVFFGNKEAEILTQSRKDMSIIVPKLEDSLPGQSINISVTDNNRTVFSANYIVRYDTIDLIAQAPQAFWKAATLSADGINTTNNTDLRWSQTDRDQSGYARLEDNIMEDGATYTVLRMHPMWNPPNGTIMGYFRERSLQGKKMFKAQVGFPMEGRSTDGVVFNVLVQYLINGTATWQPIKSQAKRFSGSIDNFFADFPGDVSGDFSIQLRVDAGNESNSDWAAWINPIVIARRLSLSAER